MIIYVKLNENIVIQTIILNYENEQEGINYIKNILHLDGEWKKINKNTDGEVGLGFSFNKEKNIFIPPQPAPWFVFDENIKKWKVIKNININTGEPISEEEFIINTLKFDIPNNITYPPEWGL